MTALATQPALAPAAALSPDDFAALMQAYHGVTERLQQSHVQLQAEVERLRDELAASNARLERSRRLAALGEMAAGIAHEVRNPLAAIQLYAAMIADDLDASLASARSQRTPDPAQLGEALTHTRRIVEATSGLSAVVNDVLNFARPMTPRVEPVAIEPAFHRALAEARPMLDEVGVTPAVRCRARVIHADPALLHRVLLNLVRNAAEALAAHAGVRGLTLSAAADGQTLRVADTGPGLTAEALDRLFNPFFTTRASGTGLGLTIVHRVLDAHGGSVHAANDPATGGAVFTLTFPRPRPARHAGPPADDAPLKLPRAGRATTLATNEAA